MLAGGIVSLETLVAIFISNIAEGSSSSIGMKNLMVETPKNLWLMARNCHYHLNIIICSLYCFWLIASSDYSFDFGCSCSGILAMLVDTMILKHSLDTQFSRHGNCGGICHLLSTLKI